jgi:biotin carboxyl carrier protein
MKLIAEIDGQESALEIRREGERVVAEIDGRNYGLIARRIKEDLFLLIQSNRVYECRIEAQTRGEQIIYLKEQNYNVRLIDPKKLRGAGAAGASASGAATIKAQMPGKIVRVLVEAGASVEAGQGLIVIEAMKMQNELKAPRAGTVKQINCAAGATVNAGETLIVIE